MQIALQLAPPALELFLCDMPSMVRALPITVTEIGAIPAQAKALVVSPHADWDSAPEPAGWPFGLRWVHTISAGLDGYPAWLFKGVIATNAASVTGVPLAEFCLAAILGAAKRMPEIWIDRADQWERKRLTRVSGTTLGIFGFGAIGAALAERALALGMKVQAVRRSEAPFPPGITRAKDIEALAAASDHLVLAAPANADTTHVINRASLRQARPGLHLINVARGRLVDNDALLAALDVGQIGRATLDVTEPEPLPAGHPFYSHPRIFLSAHTAVVDDQILPALFTGFRENVVRFIAGEPLHGVIAQQDLPRVFHQEKNHVVHR